MHRSMNIKFIMNCVLLGAFVGGYIDYSVCFVKELRRLQRSHLTPKVTINQLQSVETKTR
jgi:hypothetical protein